MRWLLLLSALLLAPLHAQAQSPACPANYQPPFVTGGSLFGFLAQQWAAFFGGKVDVNGGVLCNPTIMGPATLRPNIRIIGTTLTTDTIANSDGTVEWKSSATAGKTETLPSCTSANAGVTYGIVDGQGNAATYPITLTAPAGSSIGYGGTTSQTYAMNDNGRSVVIQCDGQGIWNLSGEIATVLGGSAPRSQAQRGADNYNVQDFSGVVCDIVFQNNNGATTNGSTTFTATGYTFPASAVGKHFVIFGAGAGPFYATTTGASVAAPGSGYVVGELSTLTDGTVLRVNSLTGSGVLTASIWADSADVSVPTNPVAQASSTGSGTGATFNLVYWGAPLTGTIVSVSGSTAVLSTPALNTVANQSWYYGSDSGAAIQAGMNAVGPSGTITFPAAVSGGSSGGCGTSVGLTIPVGPSSPAAMAEIRGTNKWRSVIYPLVPMTAVLSSTTTVASKGGGVRDLTIEAGGLATYGLYIDKGDRYRVEDVVIRDATGSDFRCGDGVTSVLGGHWTNIMTEHNAKAFARSQIANIGLDFQAVCTDQIVTNYVLNGAQSAGVYDGGAGNQFVNGHIYGSPPSDLSPTNPVNIQGIEAIFNTLHIDSAQGNAILINGGSATVKDAVCNQFSNSPLNPCVNITNNSNVTVGGIVSVPGTTQCRIAYNGKCFAAREISNARLIPYAVAQSGTLVNNSGLRTTETLLAGAQFPTLGDQDALKMSLLFSTGGNSENFITRLSTTTCTVLTACTAGTQVNNQSGACPVTGSLVGVCSVEQWIRNAGATNSQVGGVIGTTGSTPAVETNAGGFINVDCISATTGASDACGLLGATLVVYPGWPT